MDICNIPNGHLVHITTRNEIIISGVVTNDGWVKATNTIVLDNKTVISVGGLMFKEKYMSANMEEVYSYYEQEPDFDLGII